MADIVDLMLPTGCRIGEILAIRWSDVSLASDRSVLVVSGTVKTDEGRGTYRKATPKSASSVRAIVLPDFAVALLRRRRAMEPPNALDAVFATRAGTWHQVGNIKRRWRQIRQDTGFDWVTPHSFRKTVATLIADQVDSETAAQQLVHSSAHNTREHYIAKPEIAADVADVLQALGADGVQLDNPEPDPMRRQRSGRRRRAREKPPTNDTSASGAATVV